MSGDTAAGKQDPAPLLIDLAGATDLAAVGAKSFNLGRLARLGIPTPGGVVIPDAVFQRHLSRAGVAADVAGLFARLEVLDRSDLESTAASIRERIGAAPLEPPLIGALCDAWRSRWPKRLLVVRSSAVGEDSTRHSFAGQLDSFLHIGSAASLDAAIKATWCSLFAVRVLLYARGHALRAEHMGVIVQPQVDARLSGVLFTREPSGRHADAMLAEYGGGLGEAIVAGRVTPSRIRIDRQDLALVHEHVAQDTALLNEDAVRAIEQIARIGLRLESESGVPQDLEWCIEGEGRPVIVQARPATRQATCAARQGAAAGVHWTNANIAENFPEPVTPFLFSIVKPGYSAYFRNLGLAFGFSRRRLETMAEPLETIVGLQGGRLYYNLTNIHALVQLMPGGRRLAEYFDLFVGARAVPLSAVVPLGRIARAVETLRIGVSVLWQYLFIGRRLRRFEIRADKFARRTRPEELARRSVDGLAVDLQNFLTIRLHQWTDAALADTAAMACYGLLKARLTRSLGAGDHASLHNDLLKGLPNLASAIPVSRLWHLSRDILRSPELVAVFSAAEPAEILRLLAQDRCSAFMRAFRDYLETWGFRSSGELMLTNPTPWEDPRPVLRLLQAYLRSNAEGPEERGARQKHERLAATERVAARLSPMRWWRWVPLLSRASRFRILLAATQGAIALRERARMKQALLYTRLRHIALCLGDRLVHIGAIAQREDVFLLTVTEVLELAAGRTAAPDFAATVESRRKQLLAANAVLPPDHLVLDKGVEWSPGMQVESGAQAQPGAKRASVSSMLHGIGACGGKTIGTAVVVRDVANADRVRAGQILVTRQTDPGWAAVFFLVRGLVIERGGMLSHGAIIAREYGIPAVVGVPDATRLIRDGDTIHVNGDEGVVELGTG